MRQNPYTFSRADLAGITAISSDPRVLAVISPAYNQMIAAGVAPATASEIVRANAAPVVTPPLPTPPVVAAQQPYEGPAQTGPSGQGVDPRLVNPNADIYSLSIPGSDMGYKAMKTSHQQFLAWFAGRYPQYARAWSIPSASRPLGAVYDQDGNDLGDFWSESRDKIMANVKGVIDKAGAAAQQVTSNWKASDVGRAVAEAKLIQTNIKRAEQGLPPINALDVGGFADVKMLGWGALAVLALLMLKK